MISEIKQILQEIDIQPDATENESGSKAVFVLLQLVERLNQENEILKIENQKLQYEVNLLKGECSRQQKRRLGQRVFGVCPYHQIDDTTVRVNGKNKYSQIFCNPCYTAFFTVPHKTRLTILDILLCGKEKTYLFDSKAFGLLSDFNVSKKIISQTMELTYVREMSEAETQELLSKLFTDATKKGKNTKTRIMEAAAIDAYQRQTEVPILLFCQC